MQPGAPKYIPVKGEFHIADKAGYDDDMPQQLEKVLAASPELDQLVGPDVIEESCFEAC